MRIDMTQDEIALVLSTLLRDIADYVEGLESNGDGDIKYIGVEMSRASELWMALVSR
jgi:hypothetical protein